GAIILVVVIVLLVPELLSGPSHSAPPAQAALAASSEEAPLRSYTINLADDAHSAGTPGAANAAVQASAPPQPQPIVESQPTVDPTQPATQSTEVAADKPSEQSGSAAQTSTPATSTPPPPSENSAPPPQPAGPSPQHSSPVQAAHRAAATAEKSTSPLQHLAAANGRPTERHPIEHSVPVERAEGSAGGWMVQLGVFSVQANAERLSQELKTQGFHTLVSQVAGRRPLWRVRAGPVTERAAAEQLSARLRAAGHAGSIVPK